MLTLHFLLLLILPPSTSIQPSSAAEERATRTTYRLSKPLIGDDGRIYTCSEKNLFGFESNGTISWSVHLNFTCNARIAPVLGERGKIYLVAEDRVLRIDFSAVRHSGAAVEVLFGPEPGQAATKIIGISVSTLSSCVYINLLRRGLFAYTVHGELLWSVGPVLDQFGYRLGCRRNPSDCSFTSVPVIDYCEANIYIANSDGEIYSLSARTPHFKWIQDLSSLDKVYTITAGNDGRLYVTVPARALVLALDVSTGNVLWQRNVGPLSSSNCGLVVDLNGWVSIGSLDGCVYSISPTGDLMKFPRATKLDLVIQVSPVLDCSGYAIYISQTQVEGKTNHIIGEYTIISAMRPKSAIFSLLVPATGSVYWSQKYSDQFTSSLAGSDLDHFLLDEEILLAFVAASKTGNPLACQGQKLASSCFRAWSKRYSIEKGDERRILLFLFFESAILLVLASLVRFCCVFWRKKKLQGGDLGSFLKKRHSLQLKRRALDRTVSELKQRADKGTLSSEVLEELGDLERKKNSIERKLSTTYSLGRDRVAPSSPKTLLPLHKAKGRSYSFQDAKKESLTILQTPSDTTSAPSSSSSTGSSVGGEAEAGSCRDGRALDAKGKGPIEAESSSSSGNGGSRESYRRSPSVPETSSKEFMDVFNEKVEVKGELGGDGNVGESRNGKLLKRRRTLSSNN
ncbi:protein GAMETE EXPRESSED 3 [Syzygium oleosum]|uniref:protein GAMETE EXPRESSED 3 n=1 Tax=Syzygium oleosum TaxID=219896 RepID=UPI0024BBD01A|nr:protein GAMETE EXPRESSED 3 [Syzygium oleosum]